MLTSLLILASLLPTGFPAAFQNTQPSASSVPAASSIPPAPVSPTATPPAPASAVPAEAVNEPNPVHATAQSQDRAKQIYGMDCAMCHGADGSGKGDITGTAKMLDYRDASALKSLTDGQLFYIIKNGQGDAMPGEGARAKPDETWNLVIYLRSFAKTQAAASHGPS